MLDNLSELFLQSMKDAETILSFMSFEKYPAKKKGFAYFYQYKRKDCIVEFLFGPPEYQVEMIIYKSNRKFSFKDLLSIPLIATWVDRNRYVPTNGRDVKGEVLWFLDLLKFSLKIIE